MKDSLAKFKTRFISWRDVIENFRGMLKYIARIARYN